jgi:hypothetical protein
MKDVVERALPRSLQAGARGVAARLTKQLLIVRRGVAGDGRDAVDIPTPARLTKHLMGQGLGGVDRREGRGIFASRSRRGRGTGGPINETNPMAVRTSWGFEF